jgi:polysaccharide deacetylase family protein (PEP-CTERM system associated)
MDGVVNKMLHIENAMSVDVEDYFHVSAFGAAINKDNWPNFYSRIDRNLNNILYLFHKNNVKATFFTLGIVAERHISLIRRIVDEGHELASHGYDHVRVDRFNAAEFRSDISKTKKILENASGIPVRGYRAPTFSINRENFWAFDVLAEEGYAYSSSVYPIHHDSYGVPDAPRFPFKPSSSSFWEIPMTTNKLFGYNFPCSGGGYFRIFPYWIFRYQLMKYNKTEGKPGVFYFHPWELDFSQPRINGINKVKKFRHYFGLWGMQNKLTNLMCNFSWGRIDKVYADLFIS